MHTSQSSFLPPAEPMRPPESFESILQNVRSLQPFLRSRGQAIEDARRLPAEVAAKLRESGVFRICVPRSDGGPELDSMQQSQVFEELALGDSSAAWCAMIGCDAGLFRGFLDDDACRELLPELDMVQAVWSKPTGRADEVEGGYMLSGRWAFGSGCTHADIMGGGAMIYRDGEPVCDEQGNPQWRIMVAPAAAFEVFDTWHTTGLRGSGSCDFAVRGSVFVPHNHSFDIFTPLREGPLWARPDVIMRKMVGIPLGLTRRAIDDFVDIMRDRVDRPSGIAFRDMARIRQAVAESERSLGAARFYVYGAMADHWKYLEAGEMPPERVRAELWLSRFNAFDVAARITRLLFDSLGGPAIYSHKSPLDRALRDAQTMRQHLVGQQRSLEAIGGMLLGAIPNSERRLI